MFGCSRRRSSSRRRRSAACADARLRPTPSRASARGCSGSTASRRSSNGRKENDEQEAHGRGTGRDEGGAEGRGRGRGVARGAREDDAGRPCHRRADPRDHQEGRARAHPEDLVRDAGLREQGGQGRRLLPRRREVQGALRDARLQRQREARRRLDVADCLRAAQADQGRRGEDREARQAGGGLTMNDTTVTMPNELEIRVERVFDAPRAHVFSVWTDPQLIPEWWGDGTVVEEMDVRPGGTWRFRTAFGVVEGEFREVEPPERLVQTFQNHLQTLEFEDLGGQTKLTQTMRFSTQEERDTTMQYGVEEGAKGGFARIDAVLERLAGKAG